MRMLRAGVVALIAVTLPIMTFVAVPWAVVRVVADVGPWSLVVTVPLVLLLWTVAVEAVRSCL
ncbi:hypothetical protein [Nocardia sp. NPDC057455]|uniref:hypothetical protein n=1 Tax=Nocardia sp. NPDC057455 TaxID=3346138 RepID=UPI00366D4884